MPFSAKVSHRDNDRSDAENNADGLSGMHKTAPNDDNQKLETLKCFLGDTTLHGARFLFVESFLRRLFWNLALLTFFSTCYYLGHQVIKEFFRRPFNTKITTKSTFKNEMIFPAVTLCNFNSVNMIKVRHLLSQSNSSEEEIAKKIDEMTNILTWQPNVVMDDAFKKRHAILFDRNGIEALMKESAHQIEEMLLPSVPPAFISCSFNGLLCGAENFSSFTSSFGQCFTFNSGKNSSPLLKTTISGKNSGLKLRLNIQRDSYIINTKHPFVGVAVLIHDNSNFPFIDGNGIGVEPGVHTFFSIKMKKIINLPDPYETNCTQRRLNMFESGPSYAYSKPACLMQCRNEFVVNKCGCRFIECCGKAQVCAPNDTILCVSPALDEFSSSKEGHKCELDCSEPCQHVEYETFLSYARLQRNVFVDHLLAFLNGPLESSASKLLYKEYQPFINMTISERNDFIDDNIVSFDVYFNDLNYEEFRQVPSYKLWTLIASLGGNFGLFLGVSFLTMCEFLDYGVRKIYHKFFSHKRNGS